MVDNLLTLFHQFDEFFQSVNANVANQFGNDEKKFNEHFCQGPSWQCGSVSSWRDLCGTGCMVCTLPGPALVMYHCCIYNFTLSASCQ